MNRVPPGSGTNVVAAGVGSTPSYGISGCDGVAHTRAWLKPGVFTKS